MSSLASAEPRSVDLAELEAGLGHRFGDRELLEGALTHRSWCAEHGGTSNERLEFLGDAVLGMAIAHRIYRVHPDLPEGHLAMIRAAVVSSAALAEVERAHILQALRLAHGKKVGAARLLRIDRNRLYRLIRKHAITPGEIR